jgi:hypothetical protein
LLWAIVEQAGTQIFMATRRQGTGQYRL